MDQIYQQSAVSVLRQAVHGRSLQMHGRSVVSQCMLLACGPYMFLPPASTSSFDFETEVSLTIVLRGHRTRIW